MLLALSNVYCCRALISSLCSSEAQQKMAEKHLSHRHGTGRLLRAIFRGETRLVL